MLKSVKTRQNLTVSLILIILAGAVFGEEDAESSRRLPNANGFFGVNNWRNGLFGYPGWFGFSNSTGIGSMAGFPGMPGFSGMPGFLRFHGAANYPNQPLYSECNVLLNTPGTCMPPSECASVSGMPSGFCSKKTLCCAVSLQCGGSSSAKKIVIQGSVSIPSQTPCTYTVNRFSSHVCQLRVDFSTNMPQPTVIPPGSVPGTMPYCGTSYLSIGEMRFCGINTNQHIYLPFGQKTISETISVLIGSNNNANWRVIVTQLECPPDTTEEFKQLTHTSPGQILDINKLIHKQHFDTDLIAPNGCLQYFPNRTGVFESFNYNAGAGPYLPGMKYAICFDRPATFSNIQFSAERFNMSRADPSYIDVPMTDAECIDERGDTLVHHNDHFLIPYSTILQTGDSATRYCGDILEGQNLIANPPGPLEVLVNIGTLYYPLNFGPRPQRAFRVSYSIQ